MKKKLFTAAIGVVLLFSACSNDSDPKPSDPPGSTKTQLIQQKWSFAKQLFISYEPAMAPDTFEANLTPADYVEFKSDGLAYSYVDGDYDTTEYKIINEDSIYIDDADFKITRIDNSNFHFQSYTPYPDGSYEIGIIELKR